VSQIADSKAVYSATDISGITYYYTIENGAKYSVTPTEELTGGEFFPATIFISYGKRLFFCTEDGHLCVFNNDKRGEAPESVKSQADYDEEKYNAAMGNKIHPLFYSFAGHAPTYEIRTALDNCGIPHLTKNTVKSSLVIKARSAVADSIFCEVRSDSNSPIHVGNLPMVTSGFDNFDFSSSPWYNGRYESVALKEKEKRWIEKQITLTSKSFASPISLYSITYRYTIKGKIKNNV
jgi:hypothetical protein